MIVMKFGGTSIADAERIRAVCGIVSGRVSRRPLVVASALAGVTDLLVRAVAAARADDRDGIEPVLADVVRRHRWAIEGAITDARLRHDLALEFDASVEELRQILRAVRILGEGTPRASDAALSFGEIVSSKILATSMRDRGLPARWIDPRAIMVTDGRHGLASADLGAVRNRAVSIVSACAEAGEIPVTGGFVGATPDGRTSTLGRGGSDTSASVLGAAIDAEEIEIWTDVAGILTADPRIVPAARTVPEVSFAEAAELAYYGAKVLHPASIEPAVGRGIPVHVLSSLEPARGGTVVRAERASGERAPVASVASRGGVRTLRFEGRSLRMERGYLRQALASIEEEGGTVDLLASSEVGATAVVPGAVDVERLRERVGGRVESGEERGIVCVVGVGLARDAAIRAEVGAALAEHGPDLVSLGGSATSASAVYPEGRLVEVVRALHGRFFEGGGQT